MNWPLKRAEEFIAMYENRIATEGDREDFRHCLSVANQFKDLVANAEYATFDKEKAKVLMALVNERTDLGAGWLDMQMAINYWFTRMLKEQHVKVLPGFEWYDYYLSGLCEFQGQKRYFHWMEGGDRETPYKPRVYFVYEIDYVPELKNGWRDLEAFNKIGSFDEDEISPDSATLCDDNECCSNLS